MKKKTLFRLLTLLISVALFGVVELGVRILANAPDGTDPYVSIGPTASFFDRVEVDGKDHWRVVHDEVYRGRNVLFPVQKNEGTLRVFCLGGSASAGWPHPKTEIYSAYLEQALRTAYPDRDVEVINASAHAYASYRVRQIFDRVIDFNPDLIVLYSGNNEFLEKRTYLTRHGRGIDTILSAANRLATFRLLRYWYTRAVHPFNSLSGTQREHVGHEIWTKVARVALTLRTDPQQFESVKRHYAFNIEQMARTASDRGVGLLLVTVPVNLRDWQPNVSCNPLAPNALADWQAAFYGGRRALLEEDPDGAIGRLGEAIEMAPEHAESHFLLARALEWRGETDAALASYTRAKDLDCNPFRALSAFNASLRSIAAEYPHAYLADAEGAFPVAASASIPGFDLFLDYVHPTKKGNLVVARTVFDAIIESGIPGAPTGARRFTYVPRPYDEKTDLKLQENTVWLFAMMHQYESMVEKAERYSGPELMQMPTMKRIADVFPPYVELRRKKILGLPVDPAEEQAVKSAVAEFYGEKFASLSREDAARLF